MNQKEIFNGLWTITKEKYDACKADTESVDNNHPTEKGALQLKSGIYSLALAAGLISGSSDNATELMSKRFRNLIRFFPDLASHYQSLSVDEKGIMEVALYPEVFMRANFYNSYITDLLQAKKDGDPQKIFKSRLKKEVLYEILDMWQNFRVQNDLFVFAFGDKEI